MNVYIDSNFLLEQALQQEQAASVYRILWLSENKHIMLVCPILAACEPISRINYRRIERAERSPFRRVLTDFLSDLKRSPQNFQAIQTVSSLLKFAEAMNSREEQLLQQELKRMLRCCRLLPLNDSIVTYAESFQKSNDLTLSDAIIAASIFADLHSLAASGNLTPSIFVNRDRNDFEGFRDELKKFQCSFIPSLDDAVKRIEVELKKPPSSSVGP